MFQLKSAYLVHSVVCFCHAPLPISMHCGLLVGELSEILCFRSNLLVLLILWFVYTLFYAYFNALRITSG